MQKAYVTYFNVGVGEEQTVTFENNIDIQTFQVGKLDDILTFSDGLKLLQVPKAHFISLLIE